MIMKQITKPAPGACSPDVLEYTELVPDDGLVLQHLKDNCHRLKQLISSLPEEKLAYRYAPGKWTIRNMLVHMMDDERIYVYRALCMARGEKGRLPGYDADIYGAGTGADERNAASLLEEYEAVRNATIAFFNGLTDEALNRTGIANENTFVVSAIAYHIAGHELHHLKVIQERYLNNE